MTARILNIGIVTCSTRPARVNPYITSHIHALLTTLLPSLHDATLHLIDLESYALPLLDEPAVPASLPAASPTPHYQHAHTRRWSAAVRALDAFVFVAPQHNWSVPASLKNALDYLYHEWAGKPAVVVTYGSRGGGRAAAHLRDILTGLRMRVVGAPVLLCIRMEDVEECVKKGEAGEGVVKSWEEAGVGETLREAVGEMLG